MKSQLIACVCSLNEILKNEVQFNYQVLCLSLEIIAVITGWCFFIFWFWNVSRLQSAYLSVCDFGWKNWWCQTVHMETSHPLGLPVDAAWLFIDPCHMCDLSRNESVLSLFPMVHWYIICTRIEGKHVHVTFCESNHHYPLYSLCHIYCHWNMKAVLLNASLVLQDCFVTCQWSATKHTSGRECY